MIVTKGIYRMGEIRRYSDLMQQAAANMIARQDKITDFNTGSIIHTFLDTVYAELANAFMLPSGRGTMIICGLFRIPILDLSGKRELRQTEPYNSGGETPY
jgi:hypothetical protein